MQRIEPADVRTYAEPLANGPTPVESPLRGPQAVHSPVNEPPAVESVPAPKPQASGAAPLWASFLFSVLWIAGIGSYVVGLVGIEKALTLSNEWYFLIGAIAIVPIAMAILIAVFAREANALRQQSSSLAAVAAHLTEPEEAAAKNLARLSRAIRRELETFNSAVEAASNRMATLESASNERLALIERTAAAAQERVERATNRLGSEREKLAQFTQALDTVVLAASETLTTRLQDARAAARSASESLHAEHGAIAGLISTLQSASHAVSAKALETSKEIERQSQRLDAASEAAAARSEQVVARHERQRAALAETIERLKQENDHMARALDYQREGMNKLVTAMADENKKIGTFTVEGARRLDDAAALMAQRIVETTQLFSREAEKLRTSTELTTSGLEQAMQTIRSAGDSSFDAAGRLGSVLVGLRDTATTASQQIEGTVSRLSKMLNEMPAEAAHHVKTLRSMLDEQSDTMRELNSKVSAAFDRVQAIEMTRGPAPLQLEAPIHTTTISQASQMPMARQQPMAQPLPLHHQPVQHQPSQHQPSQHQPLHSAHQPAAHAAQPPLPHFSVTPQEAAAAMGGHQKSHLAQPGREPQQRHAATQFRTPPVQEQGVPNFNVPPPGAHVPLPGYSQNKHAGQHPERPEASESRGWFGLGRRLGKQSSEEPLEAPMDDRNGAWDMKSLLAAAEIRDTDRRNPAPVIQQPMQQAPRRMDPRDPRVPDRNLHNELPPQHHPQHAPHPQHPPHQQHPQQGRQHAGHAVPQQRGAHPQADANGGQPGHTSSRHMIETLQAMAIDLSRFLEDDPPADLLRRYRNGERNVFARRLASILGAEHVRMIAGKYQEDREFRDTVDRYIQQFEALLEQTAKSDRENVLVETYLTSQTGKVYVTLASAIGRLS